MLLHAPQKTSLLFSAPSPPSPGSRCGRGGTERPPAAPRAAAAGTARGIECRAQPCPAPGEPPGAALQLRTPRDVRRPDAQRAAAAAASPASFLFLLEVFSPTPFAPPPSSAPSSAYPPRSAPRRSGPRSQARAGACRAPRFPRGNFWTRWWCPLGEGEERSRGTRGRKPIRRRRPGAEPGRGGATGVGGGARPLGKPWRALTERGEALEGRRDPRTGQRSPESRPGEARLGVRQFPPGKAKDGGAETQSLVLKGAGRIEN